ncbi:lasso peptide biosynthesis PqqD family chaperone [Bacillus sp. 1P10SD]|uniref:lasso peptide biosynthesis PqqD family chaperone n=1 Tax=Bacillus sp. 1P10SD TaxID=3132265 RepID=UPI0039A750C2
MIIYSEQTIEQSKDIIVSKMGEEKVMLSITNGKYYNLGELGGDIWDLLSNPKPLNQLVMELVKVYDVEQNQCEEQVKLFLEQLLEEGLIKLV